MSIADITFQVHLDEKKMPKKIIWHATDKGNNHFEEAQAISISTWHPQKKHTLRIDLWTDKMPLHEMKYFTVDIIGSLGQSILKATGDEIMAQKINKFCESLVQHIQKSTKKKHDK